MHDAPGVALQTDLTKLSPFLQFCQVFQWCGERSFVVAANAAEQLIYLLSMRKRSVNCVILPRERMRSPQPTRNYSVEIPTWSTHTQRRRLSARRAARIAG